MTPSIEERREVAERLRKTRGLHACSKDLIELELSERIGAFRENGMSWDYICDRLADLIEPLPDRTCRAEVYPDGAGAYVVCCSECGFGLGGKWGDAGTARKIAHGEHRTVRYCPNCGARVIREEP